MLGDEDKPLPNILIETIKNLSGFMALFIASIFRRLSSKFPGESGPFHYTEKSFGEFISYSYALDWEQYE